MKLIFALLLFSGVARCQPTGAVRPDCNFQFQLTAAGNTPQFNNQNLGCTTWTLQYYNAGFTGLTITLQSAPPASITTPGTFVTYAGSLITGVHPGTSTTGGTITFSNAPATVAWLQITLAGLSGSGVVFGTLQGWVSGPSGSSPSGGGCPGTTATPCQTQAVGNGTVLSGQQTVTTSAVALSTNSARNVCVKALVGNSVTVYLGPSGLTTATGMELAPGDSWCGPVSNTNLLFVRAASSGGSVSWIGTN